MGNPDDEEKKDESNASKGGNARRDNLSPEQRKDIAKRAAAARWHGDVPSAVCDGTLKIGDLEIACSVLADGTRVLSEREFTKALGGKRGGAHWQRKAQDEAGARLPVFLSAMNLRPFVSKDLALALMSPISYAPMGGGGRANGIEATVIPEICNVFLKAREEGALHPSQVHIAQQAEIIIRGLARVGIVALVDEATGYEDQRPKNALAEILKAFISEELRRYAETFPLAYFREVCRLKGIPFKADMKLPKYFGHYTNDIIYRRLAPAVLDELRKKNPVVNGRRRHRHYQYLTDNIGHPKLLQHLGSVVTLMRLSDTWEEFKTKIDKIHPRYQPFPLVDRLGTEDSD